MNQSVSSYTQDILETSKKIYFAKMDRKVSIAYVSNCQQFDLKLGVHLWGPDPKGGRKQGSYPLGRQRLAALSQGERGEVLDTLVHLRLGEGGQQLPQLVLHGDALGERRAALVMTQDQRH